MSALCNGFDDCMDGSFADEKDCTGTTCSDGYVSCLQIQYVQTVIVC